MASIERTAYPLFKATLTTPELTNLYRLYSSSRESGPKV